MPDPNRHNDEFEGHYPESELVEDLLGKGEEFDYLRFQMAQNAITDQRWAANAAQALALSMLGKSAVSFPKSAIENVVSENVSKTVNDDSSLTTSRETLETMADKMAQTVSLFRSAVDDMQAQMSDVIDALARVEVTSL